MRAEPGDALLRALKEAGAEAGRVTLREKTEEELSVSATGRKTLISADSGDGSAAVLCGGRLGTVSGPCRSEDDARALASAALSAAAAASPEANARLSDTVPCSFRNEPAPGSPELLVQRAEELLAGTAVRFPHIRFVSMKLSRACNVLRILDLAGREACDESGCYMLDTSFCAVGPERSTSFSGMTIRLAALDRPLADHPDVRRALEFAERQLENVTFEKPAPVVVLAPSVLGMLFYQLTNRLLSDQAFLSGTGRWHDKLGERVADPRLTLRLVSSGDGILAEPQITAEGRPAENETLLDRGILRGTLLSERAAAQTGAPRCTTDSRCFVMPGGDTPLEELLSGIRSGILVTRLSGGIPNLSGEISGVAKSSFRIENGRLSSPVEGVTLSGSLLDVLSDLGGISREVSRDGTGSLPYLLTEKLRIS